MTTLDRDIEALRAAIAAGDDSALPALADALEEQNDRQPMRIGCGGYEWWVWCLPCPAHHGIMGPRQRAAEIEEAVFRRLPRGLRSLPGVRSEQAKERKYSTRRAAYLALARALAESAK